MDVTTLPDWLPGLARAASPPAPAGLALAFLLGLLHAFDADHVSALSVFATRGRSAAEGMRAGLRWSAGHGAIVLLAGALLVAAGRVMPASFSAAADRLVGVVMIGLGAWVFAELARTRTHLHFHRHDDLPPHAHWHRHAHDSATRAAHQHTHGPLLVGALHGLAGSAPILALLPIAQASPSLALAFLVVFGLGVAVAMAGVSGLLGHVAGRLSRGDAGRGLVWLRGVGAGGSVTIGAWLAWTA